MSIMQSIRETVGWREERRTLKENIEIMRENIGSITQQLRREDAGWSRLGDTPDSEFSASQRLENATICRTLAIANPLAKNGLAVRAAFIWGSGIGVTAEDAAANDAVQAFLDDQANRDSFTGHQAHLDLETALGTDGDVFIGLYTNRRTGQVDARILPFTQVTEIITNPDDYSEKWFYRRSWTRKALDGSYQTMEELHPDVRHKPALQKSHLNGVTIRWDAPLVHVHDNGLAGWQYGVPDLYAAINWIRGYNGFLNDWARLTRSLSRIAYKVTGKDKGGVLTARSAMQSAMVTGQAGGAIGAMNADIEAMPKTGATIDSNSGDPLARMIGAALGVPITLLFGDPGTTGARAVAETLTQPMVLGFKNRRELWTEAYRAILTHVITASQEALAPAVRVSRGASLTLTIEWPEIEDVTLEETMSAVSTSKTLGLVPDEVLARLVLRALKVRDVDEVIDSMRDGEGNFTPSDANVAEALLGRYDRGEL